MEFNEWAIKYCSKTKHQNRLERITVIKKALKDLRRQPQVDRYRIERFQKILDELEG